MKAPTNLIHTSYLECDNNTNHLYNTTPWEKKKIQITKKKCYIKEMFWITFTHNRKQCRDNQVFWKYKITICKGIETDKKLKHRKQNYNNKKQNGPIQYQ